MVSATQEVEIRAFISGLEFETSLCSKTDSFRETER